MSARYSPRPSVDFNEYSPYPQPYGTTKPIQTPYGQADYPPLPPTQQQIVSGDWMIAPIISGCPPGLEYLTQIDQLIIHQKVELLEVLCGCETKNKYKIKNSLGQKVYTAKEDSDCLTRNCCGPNRSFEMKMTDYQEREVLHFYRPLRCSLCCFPWCLQRLEVTAYESTCGFVEQVWSLWTPKFNVCNADGEIILYIEGPGCNFAMCGEVEFKVYTFNDKTQVGRITKKWTGLSREAFTDADHFGISFPMDLDVNIKAVLLGACFLIDFMYFEKPAND